MTWKQIDAGPSEPTAVNDEGDIYAAVYKGELSQNAAAKQLGIPRGTFINRYRSWERYHRTNKSLNLVAELQTESSTVETLRRRNDELETENKALKSLIMSAMRTA